jgi:predicted O-methyltransferase YrrM
MTLRWHVRKLLVKWRNRKDGVLAPPKAILAAAPRSAAIDPDSGIRNRHKDYVSRISTDVAAASLEVCYFIAAQIAMVPPRAAVDLGSGFSSYLLRRQSAKAGVSGCSFKVTSVDTDPAWLDKTGNFLKEMGCDPKGLVLWEDFIKAPLRDADLVFHDLGGSQTRVATLPVAFDLCRKGAVLIIDDIHKPTIRQAVLSETAKRAMPCFDLIDTTLDHFGRYSWAVIT